MIAPTADTLDAFRGRLIEGRTILQALRMVEYAQGRTERVRLSEWLRGVSINEAWRAAYYLRESMRDPS